METLVSPLRALRRIVSAHLAIASISLKSKLAYVTGTWYEFFLQIISLVAFVYFWRAVYAGKASLAGLSLQQTLNYVILAQMLLRLLQAPVTFRIMGFLREGELSMELVKPVDLQSQFYATELSHMLFLLVQRLPILLIACLFFGLRLPSDVRVWAAFGVSLFLGHLIIFFFEWTFACLAFYTTDFQGPYQMREGVARFFSGAFVPVMMMPSWLQAIAQSLPFAQAISVPVSLLSGSIPLAEAPRVWLVQLIWVLGLAVFSRLVFRVAVRQVTIQGG